MVGSSNIEVTTVYYDSFKVIQPVCLSFGIFFAEGYSEFIKDSLGLLKTGSYKTLLNKLREGGREPNGFYIAK